jgi:iron complex outermembrane receptor protein
MKLGNGAFHTVAEGNILGAPQTVEISKSWSGITPRLAVSYKLSDAVNVYGSFNKGYKAGGFNNYTGITFEPETNNAMEAGLKTNIGNDKGRLNVSVYNYDYKDLQVESIINGAVEVTNAADVATKGAEVEFGYELFPGLQVIANYSLTDAEYVNYDVDDSTSFSGNIPARSPKTSYNTILQYRKPVGNIGDLFARLDYSYQSKVFHTRENDINFSDPYSLVNGSIGLDNAFGTGINVSLFGANLTDEEYVVYAEDILGVGPYYLMGFPMTVGVRLSIDGFNW